MIKSARDLRELILTCTDLKIYIKEFLLMRRSSLAMHALRSSHLDREYASKERAFLWILDLSNMSESS